MSHAIKLIYPSLEAMIAELQEYTVKEVRIFSLYEQHTTRVGTVFVQHQVVVTAEIQGRLAEFRTMTAQYDTSMAEIRQKRSTYHKQEAEARENIKMRLAKHFTVREGMLAPLQTMIFGPWKETSDVHSSTHAGKHPTTLDTQTAVQKTNDPNAE